VGAPRCLYAIVALAFAVGCGGDGEERESARATPPPVTDAAHRAEVARDPYTLTCGDLAAQPRSSINQRLVINAEFALAEAPELRRRVEEMTSNRVGRSVYWALTEICKGRPESFRPARDAVEAVRQGKYLVQPRPQSWSDPEQWSGSED
jgi:hypothetical protein